MLKSLSLWRVAQKVSGSISISVLLLMSWRSKLLRIDGNSISRTLTGHLCDFLRLEMLVARLRALIFEDLVGVCLPVQASLIKCRPAGLSSYLSLRAKNLLWTRLLLFSHTVETAVTRA